MRQGLISWLEQIIRSMQEWKPTVIDNSPKDFRLINKIKEYTGLYDGENHKISVDTEENCVVEYSIDQQKWEVHSPTFCNAGLYTVYVRVTRNKWVEHAKANVNIQKRTIILHSESISKEYDGTPVVNHEVSIRGDGIVKNESITAEAKGSQLLVGKCINTIEFQFEDNKAQLNYVVRKEEGTLEITSRKEKYHVTIKGKDAEFIYDGMVSVVQGFITEKVLIGSIEYYINGISSYASLKHVGEVKTRIAGICRIIDQNGNNVRDQFDVQIIPGTLRVYPRNVKLTSASERREYNGSELVNREVKITGDGFVQGEEPIIISTGRQQYVGISDNTFTYKLPEIVNKNDYIISTEYGTLEICNRNEKYRVDVYLNGGKYLYDGAEHTASGIKNNYVQIDGKVYTIEIIDHPIHGKNVVVSTGTGSGKTESFLLPILSELASEAQNGSLCPGVRALLIYPMNALANVFIVSANNKVILLTAAINNTDAVSRAESITSEKCLLYVALTRAQKGVYITCYGKKSEFLIE